MDLHRTLRTMEDQAGRPKQDSILLGVLVAYVVGGLAAGLALVVEGPG